MKQNYKTKYFLKQILDLAYLAKKANQNYILIKTKNLTVPFSDWQLKTMAKDCEALTLLKRGGYYNEETSKLEANHYAFDFELLQKLYKENPCKLRNLRKELANRKINVTAKKVKHLDEPDINSKYRCQYYINSIKDAEDYIMNVRYKNLFSALKDDVMIANTFLDEPRKLKYQIKVTTRKDGALKKIGFRCTNAYVSAKKEDDKNEKFHGKFKNDILAYYSLKEFDNSDVTSSIPRLTAVKNGKKWNEIEDYYIEILKYTMKLIDMKFRNDSKLDNQYIIDEINTFVINNQSIDYKLSYHSTAEGKLNKCIANKEKEKVERNQAILNDYKAGMKQKDIATKYNVNVTRVSQLLKKYKNK